MDKYAGIIEAGIDGINYDLETEDIIAQLKVWDARFGIESVAVDGQSFTIQLRTLPEDVLAFAEEVAAFCPDTIMQGFDSPEALAEDIAETHEVYFWWD